MPFRLLDLDADELRSHPDDLGSAMAQLDAADLAPLSVGIDGSVDDTSDAVAGRDRIRAFCESHPDALHRSSLEGHLTGSAAIVDAASEQVLLIHHVKLDRWLQPGGHADGEGSLALVARTEAEEETGLTDLRVVWPAIDVDVHGIPERGDVPAHLHLDVRFCVIAPPDAVVSADPTETKGARWVRPEELDAVDAGGELGHLVRRALTVARSLA